MGPISRCFCAADTARVDPEAGAAPISPIAEAVANFGSAGRASIPLPAPVNARIGTPGGTRTAVPAISPAPPYQRQLIRWQREAPYGERSARRTAVKEIKRIVKIGRINDVVLDLSSLGLTSLPEFPPDLTHLNVSFNQLTRLPPLPPTLDSLNATFNRLAELPELPASLDRLHLTANELHTLPKLPDQMTVFGVDANSLSALPDLPPSLIKISATYNKLTRLPALPSGLQELCVNNNLLETLPALPAGLTSLTLHTNPPLNIPVRIVNNTSWGFDTAAVVRRWQSRNASLIDGAQLAPVPESPAVAPTVPLNTLGMSTPAELAFNADDIVPIRDNDVLPLNDYELDEALRIQMLHDEQPDVDREVAALARTEQAGSLHAPAELHMPAFRPATSPPSWPSTRQRGITGWVCPASSASVTETRETPETSEAPTSEAPAAAAFQQFLDRMRGGSGRLAPAEYGNSVSRPLFVARVDALLDAMENSPALRSICLTIAADATSACGDRIGLAFNDMEIAHINDDARQGRYTQTDLFKLGRSMYRLDLLEGIINDTIQRQLATLNGDIDPIEIRLAFQTQLSSRLQLPAVSQAMLHRTDARLTERDFTDAANAVLKKEAETGGIEFLISWQPWQEAMKRRNPASYRRVEQSIQEHQEAFAVMPSGLTSQVQRTLYDELASRKKTEIEYFTKVETMNFLNENEAAVLA